MAATCTAAGLIEVGKCFTSPGFNSHSRKAVIVYLLNIFGSAVGADVSDDFPALLRNAVCLRNLTSDQRESAVIGILNSGFPIDYGLVNAVGSITTKTPAEIISGIECLKNYSDEDLEVMTIYLICLIWGAQASLA